MELLPTLILGIVQGITEFLPISSTGHLILVRAALEINDAHALAFDAILHLATASAVVVYFWRDIYVLLQTVLRMLSRMPVEERHKTLLVALITGTIPAAIFGFLLEDIMATLFRSPLLVATVLIVGSALFAYAEYVHIRIPKPLPLTVRTGFKIGLFQSLALIPGMSRSGSAISGGLIFGMSRLESARFAFLLAIPILLGAGLKTLLELFAFSDGAIAWPVLIAGAVAAFCVALLAIRFMLGFIQRYSLWPFIWYRILLAAAVILFVFFG